MARDVFHQLYYHVVWATLQRSPILANRRDQVVAEVTRVARRFGAHVLACNTMPDHVHRMVSLPPVDLAQFLGKVKGGSSFALNHQKEEDQRIRWQDGYGVVSLRSSDTPTVIHYIENQEQIHTDRDAWPTLEQTESGSVKEPADGKER